MLYYLILLKCIVTLSDNCYLFFERFTVCALKSCHFSQSIGCLSPLYIYSFLPVIQVSPMRLLFFQQRISVDVRVELVDLIMRMTVAAVLIVI